MLRLLRDELRDTWLEFENADERTQLALVIAPICLAILFGVWLGI